MEAPRGATWVARPETGEMRPNGWRKMQDQAGVTALADAGAALEAAKGRCLVAVKRVAAHIGLKAGDLLLLDTLAAFTQAQDWQAGQRAIVWPSNALLMAQTGFSRSALKRYVRRLSEAGLVAFRDSPNGKRWGHRNGAGDIVEAYGFDLSPLAAQAQRFEDMAREIAAERALCQRLRRRLTGLRRSIRDHLERTDAAQFASRFDVLRQAAPTRMGSRDLMSLLARFEELLSDIEAALDLMRDDSEIRTEMGPMGSENGPHLQDTNEQQTVKSNAGEKEPGRMLEPDMETIVRGCPEFATWAESLGHPLRDWADMGRVAGQMRRMIAVRDATWHLATETLGARRAALAIALIFEKVHAGRVAAPDAYLRGMLAKDRAGALHLERSLAGQVYAVSCGEQGANHKIR